MCGIVGYVGSKQVVPVILEGRRRPEYHGYESAGIAGNGHELQVRRVIATEGDNDIVRDVEYVISAPQTTDRLSPIIETIPMQLLAYAVAVHRECDVDQPRNLAKSVAVE